MGRGHFWPQGYNLNNLARGPLDEATMYKYMYMPNIKDLGLLVSDKIVKGVSL